MMPTVCRHRPCCGVFPSDHSLTILAGDTGESRSADDTESRLAARGSIGEVSIAIGECPGDMFEESRG